MISMQPQLTTFGDTRLPPRFWSKIRVLANGCWEWIAYRNGSGYGVIGIGSITDGSRKSVLAHRLAYHTLVGPFPAGLQSDHLCQFRACVNPAHVEPVTSRVNTLRGNSFSARHAKKTHCPQGHPYDKTNTSFDCNGKGRHCRICHRGRVRRRYQARAALEKLKGVTT